MSQANPVGDPYAVADGSMIANTMGYTAIQLYDNGCAYMSTRYRPDPNLVEYVKTQIGDTNTYVYKYYETNANGYIYFMLTEDATNGNTFDNYLPEGTASNTYTLDMEGMSMTIKVYGSQGTCLAACYMDMGAMDPSFEGMLMHYTTVDFTYNQDGTITAMGVIYEIGADNVLTPKA